MPARRCCASSILTLHGLRCCRTSLSMRSVHSHNQRPTESHPRPAPSYAKGAGSGSLPRRLFAHANTYGGSTHRKPTPESFAVEHRAAPLCHVQPRCTCLCRPADGRLAPNGYEHGYGHGYGHEPDAPNANEHGYAVREPARDAVRHAQPESGPDARRRRTELHGPRRHAGFLNPASLLAPHIASPSPIAPPSSRDVKVFESASMS